MGVKSLGRDSNMDKAGFQAKKSTDLIIRNGKKTYQVVVKVQGEVFQSTIDNPNKCSGKWFDTSLNVKNRRIEQQVLEGMRNIDKTLKACIYQHGLLSFRGRE